MVRRSRIAVVCLAVAAVMVAGGCSTPKPEASAKAQRGGEITVVRSGDIDSWDPDMTMLVTTFQTLPLVMEGLVRPGQDGTSVEPGLAEKWVFDADAKTLTFTLRAGLTFSDGTPVTSEDVAFSVGLWRKAMMMGALYSAIEGTETPDDRTVVLKLNRPSTFTLSWLANGSAVVVPADFAGKSREDFFAKPIGAGPFVIDKHTVGQQIVLSRNEKYYAKDRPYLDRITFDVVADANQQLLRLQSGQADMIEGVPLDLTNQIPEENQVRLHPAATIYNLQVNFRGSPGNDVHFRRAASYAMDREKYIKTVFGGQAKVPTGFLPPEVAGSVGCGCEYEFSLEKAADELDRSGYQGQELKLLVNENDDFGTRAGEAAAAMLQAAGINVVVERQEIQVMLDNQQKGKFDFAIGSVSSVSPTVGDIFSLVAASKQYYSAEAIAVVEEAFAGLDVAQTDEEREQAVREVETWNHSELAVIPLAYPDRVYGISDRVHGLSLTPFGDYDADEIWVD